MTSGRLTSTRSSMSAVFCASWCESEFAKHALPVHWPQSNIAWSEKRGTLRGLHFVANQDEAKLVRCTRARLCGGGRHPTQLAQLQSLVDSRTNGRQSPDVVRAAAMRRVIKHCAMARKCFTRCRPASFPVPPAAFASTIQRFKFAGRWK